jgi:hypothetical protein
MYVALTRARDRLYLGTVLKDGALAMGRGSLAEVLPGLAEGMAADPHPPALRSSHDHRILDRPMIITGEYQVTITEWQLLRAIRVQGIDPPVLGVRGCAAEVEPPTGVCRARSRGASRKRGQVDRGSPRRQV